MLLLHIILTYLDRHLGYNLIRTFDCPQGSKILDVPSDPRGYKNSHAFGVTGVAKYFTPSWKETSAEKGISKFLDIPFPSQFPSPHNITELALNEMWGTYGTDVEISVVFNIGPGIPYASDCRNIARRFSWGSKAATTSPPLPKIGRYSGASSRTPKDFSTLCTSQLTRFPMVIPKSLLVWNAIKHRGWHGEETRYHSSYNFWLRTKCWHWRKAKKRWE